MCVYICVCVCIFGYIIHIIQADSFKNYQQTNIIAFYIKYFRLYLLRTRSLSYMTKYNCHQEILILYYLLFDSSSITSTVPIMIQDFIKNYSLNFVFLYRQFYLIENSFSIFIDFYGIDIFESSSSGFAECQLIFIFLNCLHDWMQVKIYKMHFS